MNFKTAPAEGQSVSDLQAEVIADNFKMSKEVPESFVQEMLDLKANTRVADFAASLGTARAVFRDYPELVTAEEFPEEILLSLTRPNQQAGELDPEDCLDHVDGYQGEPYITEEMKERLLPEARELAAGRWRRAAERVEAERCEARQERETEEYRARQLAIVKADPEQLYRKFDLAVEYAKRHVPAEKLDGLLATIQIWAEVHAPREISQEIKDACTLAAAA